MAFINQTAPSRRPVRRPLGGTRAAVPLERFDRATLEEAKKILLGTSPWFRFDEAGKLHRIDRSTPECRAAEQAQDDRIRQWVAHPKEAERQIAALKVKPPPTERMKAAAARVSQALEKGDYDWGVLDELRAAERALHVFQRRHHGE